MSEKNRRFILSSPLFWRTLQVSRGVVSGEGNVVFCSGFLKMKNAEIMIIENSKITMNMNVFFSMYFLGYLSL